MRVANESYAKHDDYEHHADKEKGHMEDMQERREHRLPPFLVFLELIACEHESQSCMPPAKSSTRSTTATMAKMCKKCENIDCLPCRCWKSPAVRSSVVDREEHKKDNRDRDNGCEGQGMPKPGHRLPPFWFV